MSYPSILPPHLADMEEEKRLQMKHLNVGPQGPSKYGPGGRRAAKAKGRKKKK